MTYREMCKIGRNAATYPEITTAALTGPETVDGKMIYTFTKAIGTKG
jgi:PRTRC genetic system protein C